MTLTMLKFSMVNFVSWAKNPLILSQSQAAFYRTLKLPGALQAFNKAYTHCSPSKQRLVHAAFAKIFRDRPPLQSLSSWKGSFAGTPYRIPLRAEQLWLDWDTALSLSGHDIEVKQTYLYLLAHWPLQIFFDVGANYGTHSFLMSLAGIRTVAFEPNPSCHDYFWHLLEHNHRFATLVKKGVGEQTGQLHLSYHPTETWNGRLGSSEAREGQKHLQVDIITLDAYIAQNGILPDLIKVDTEGFELKVLQGAQNLLAQQHSLIIFESLAPTSTDTQRETLFRLLTTTNYGIFSLPWYGESTQLPMSEQTFMKATDTNFIAVPQGSSSPKQRK